VTQCNNLKFRQNLLTKRNIKKSKNTEMKNMLMYREGGVSTRMGDGYCCNLPVSVALNVRVTTSDMYAKNNTHINVARTSTSKVIVVCDLCRC